MTEPVPEPIISPGAVTPLTPEQFEERIVQRLREIEQTPCYRCEHKPSAADPNCFCCLAAHTPDGDGFFSMEPPP